MVATYQKIIKFFEFCTSNDRRSGKITTKEECNNYFNNNENILTLFTTELTCYGKNAMKSPKVVEVQCHSVGMHLILRLNRRKLLFGNNG